MSTSNAERRARDRSRTLAIGIGTSVISRGLAAATPVLVIPIGLGYLGAAGYGVWAIALSVAGFVAFADLGVGSGLMTKLGQVAQGEVWDAGEAKRYVSSAYVMLTGVTGFGLALLFGSAPFVDWHEFLGVEGDQRAALDPIVLATLSAFVVNMFASLVVRVQYGVGQQGRSNLWQAGASALTLAATVLAARLDPGPGWFVAMAAFAPVLVGLLNTLVFFAATPLGRSIAPSFGAFRGDVLTRLVLLGSKFLVLSLLMTASIALDPWIVARTSDLTDVPNFAIPFRVFAFLSAFSVVLTLPLWPMHSSAVASGEVTWIRRITRRMTLANTAVSGATAVLAVLFGPQLLGIWLDGEIPSEPVLWGGLGLWWFVQSATGPAFMVQNGAEVLAPQLLGYMLFLVAFPLKWWVSLDIDYVWIPYVGAGLYVLLIWPACLVGYRQAMVRAHAGAMSETVEQ